MRVILLIISCFVAQTVSELLTSVTYQYVNERHYKNKTCRDLGYKEFLDVSNLGLETINSNFESGVPVTCLDLRKNRIDHIDADAFTRMKNLTYLNLADNILEARNFEFLNPLEELEILVLDGNYGCNVIFQMDNVYLPNLRHLHVERNRIVRKISSYRRGDRRRTPYSTGWCTKFKRLSAEEHKMIDIDPVMPKLSHVYLSDNLLSTQSALDMLPKTVTHLYVERNKFYNFTTEGLENLVALSLDGNEFETLCRNCSDKSKVSLIGRTWNLEYLSVAYNKIIVINLDTFSDASNLTYLDLSHNNISILWADVFFPLTNLQSLNLSYNRIRYVPNFCRIALPNDDDEWNDNYVLPAPETCKLGHLKALYLNNNNLTHIHNATFANLHSLEILDLSNNFLNQLPSGWMKTLPNLRSLWVRETLFNSTDDLQLSGKILEELNLQGSAIKFVLGQFFKNSNENITVYI